jgi:hypothetical protein
MKRRKFIALLGGTVAAWPLAARAQQLSSVAGFGVSGWPPRVHQQTQHFSSGFREANHRLMTPRRYGGLRPDGAEAML